MSINCIRHTKSDSKIYTSKILTEHYIEVSKIVLFKSVRNCKRCNKGNLMLKSNSNKIRLCGGGGQHFLVLKNIFNLIFTLLKSWSEDVLDFDPSELWLRASSINIINIITIQYTWCGQKYHISLEYKNVRI